MSDQQPPIDDDERELARLYGKLPRATPSPALDEAVLRQAREAVPVGDAPASARSGRTPRRGLRWAGGLAIAASLMLAANLAWQQRQLPAPDAHPEAAKDKAVSAPAALAEENTTASGTVIASQPAPTVAPDNEATAHNAPPPVAELALPVPARRARAPALQPVPPSPPTPPAAAADAMAKASAPAAAPAQALAPPPPPAEIGSPTPSPASASQELAKPALPSVDSRPVMEGMTVMESRSEAEPKRRVAAIRQMLRDGHEASARKTYADLRRDFPGFVIPRDLAPLAK